MKLKYTNTFNNYKDFLFYLIIGTISFILDVYTGRNKLYKNCKDALYTLSLLYLHHLFVSFIYFGWLSKNRQISIIHILSIFLVLIVQFNNEYRCPSTEIVNKNCNINRSSFLRDFLYFTNIKKYNNLYYLYISISLYLSLKKIM